MVIRMAIEEVAAVKAAILNAAGKKTMARLPQVIYAIKCFDPCVRDIKFVMLLEEITRNQETQLLEDLQAGDQRIKKFSSLSGCEVAILPVRLQGRPWS